MKSNKRLSDKVNTIFYLSAGHAGAVAEAESAWHTARFKVHLRDLESLATKLAEPGISESMKSALRRRLDELNQHTEDRLNALMRAGENLSRAVSSFRNAARDLKHVDLAYRTDLLKLRAAEDRADAMTEESDSDPAALVARLSKIN